MASRTDGRVLKIQEADDAFSWRLEFSPARESGPLHLQKWRVVGDGRTAKDQILEYATTFQEVHSEEGESTIAPPSLPSSSITAMLEDVSPENRGTGQSPGTRDSLMAEAETMPTHSRPSASPSSESKFTNADGYVSGQEEESKEAQVDNDNVEVLVNDAHSFKIFQPDDEDKKEPASILALDFDCNEAHVPTVRLHMTGFSSSDLTGLFTRTIDSWTIKAEGEQCLRIHVRDTNGSWIKLWNTSEGYEASVHDALIIASFLELAMNLKKNKAETYLNHLAKVKNGSSKDEIKKILWKYYNSIVKNFVKLPRVPASLQTAPIIKNMESLLKGELRNQRNALTVKRPSSSEKLKRPNNLTLAIQASLNKRRRVVDSDPENGSDEEDQIKRSDAVESEPRDEEVRSTMNRDEPGIEGGSRKLDEGSVASDDLSLSPASNKDDSSSRWSEQNIDEGGEQEFQDIAEIYCNENDRLDEIQDDDDQELGDSAFCAICDDGGDLLFCDGPCMRSFHASKQAAADSSESKCRSLGYTVEQVQDMGSWLCENCKHSQHQCFICGQLGRSEGKDKEVFVCDVALCGRFYHPHCLANWKNQEKFNGMTDVAKFIGDIKDGKRDFCCPAHKCRKCGEGEEEGGEDNSMKLAKCRRCPKAYHKSCLPKRIAFEGKGYEPIRAWEIGDDDDPLKRLVIYCLDHVIIDELSTPQRNHLKWPKESQPRQRTAREDDYRVLLSHRDHQKSPKRQKIVTEDNVEISETVDTWEHPRRPKGSLGHKSVEEDLIVGKSNQLVRPKMGLDSSVTAGKDRSTASYVKREAPVPEVTPFAPFVKHISHTKRQELKKKIVEHRPVIKKSLVPKEGQMDRLEQIMRRAAEKVTIETVKTNLSQPSCYGENRKKSFIHRGELLSILNAAKKASEKVKNGGSIEDAKRLCPKDLFLQMLRTEDMLRVHLAPFLHGMRYTSFGRHFTCVDKLNEIVERIHPYIDDGDMVVDFCCGANDFSILLSKKLSSTGKTCHFLNFDIITPKNGFCFTKGDWLENQGVGFFEGKRLIMGLNPPFGVRAALATKFILHALTFRPKLLVLIVPPETMSNSDMYKSFNYDLVWEDKELLKGHAFYLPGSMDNNDKENVTQWNVVAPPLYLWSSRDMINKHRDIAVRCKHIEGLQADAPVLHQRRIPTPSVPAIESSRQKTPPENRTNSGSLPTECDTSSSRLQLSSAASSQADGISQNSLDGSGQGYNTGRGHTEPVQSSSQTRQGSGELSSGQHVHRQSSFGRVGVGPLSAGPTLLSVAGTPLNVQIPAIPHQLHNTASPRHPKPEGVSTAGGHSGRLGLPFADARGIESVAPSTLLDNHMKHCLSRSMPEGNQAQWGRAEHQGRYNQTMLQRSALGNGDRLHPISQASHENHLGAEPVWYKNQLSGQQQRTLLSTSPTLPTNLCFPPPPLPMPMPAYGPPPPVPGQVPQAWQPPPPPFYPGRPIVHPNFPGYRQQPDGPPFAPYQRGPPQPDRRLGGGHHGVDQGSGGWLD